MEALIAQTSISEITVKKTEGTTAKEEKVCRT